MPRSQVKSSTLFQSFCGHLTSHGHQHHCEKQIQPCIHDTSIPLLDRLGAFVCIYPLSASEEAIALLYELINDLDGFCSNIFYSNSEKMLLLTLRYV